ncbi:MAG: glycosyl hydrolase, partial [Cyclobacteriaceae bacterium]
EEITNTSMVFNATLETIKVAGDQSNLSGVTHSILHGFNYSPPEAPFPGWVQYGTFFNEYNPWWPYLRLWTDYKARLSEVFMNAEPVADIAILHPLADMWMKFGPQRDPFPVVKYPPYQHNVWEAVQQNGFGCDYVSEKILQESTYSDGHMSYNSRKYKALILLEVETILPETAEALKMFSEAGGKIIFIEKAPYRSPEFKDYSKKDALVKGKIDNILLNYTEHAGIYPKPEEELILWFENICKRFDLRPYIEISNPDRFINQNYFRHKDLDIFFISNSNANESREIIVKFDIKGKIPLLWDAETGERSILAYNTPDPYLKLHFGPAESKLIVFEGQNKERSSSEAVLPFQSTERDDSILPLKVDGSWTLSLEHVDGSIESIELPELIDFLEEPRLKTFAGVVYYNKILEVADPGNYSTIDLGEVVGVSELILNDKSLGIRWYGDHSYTHDGSLKEGKNELHIKVTTVLGNYMKSLEDNPVAKRWVRWQKYRSQGLIGPVRLI